MPSSGSVFGRRQQAIFNVEANEDPSLAYQWSRNGIYIAGATSPSLSIAKATCRDSATTFSVEVSNQDGIARSETVQLKVAPCAVSIVAGQVYSAGNFGVGGSTDRVFLYAPRALSVDVSGNLFLADNDSAIRRISVDNQVTTFASVGRVSATTVDSHGTVYFAEGDLIRKVTSDGAVSTVAGVVSQPSPYQRGSIDGQGAAAGFSTPFSLAVDPYDNLLVIERGLYNPNAEGFSGGGKIRKVTPDGLVTTIASAENFPDIPVYTGDYCGPYLPSIAADKFGNVFVTSTFSTVIWKINPTGQISEFAGLNGVQGAADGLGNAARFRCPGALAVDRQGSLYVADSRTTTVRKISPTGQVSTLAGIVGNYGAKDGAAATATFQSIDSLAIGPQNQVYLVQGGSQKVRVITPDGWVRAVAGFNAPEGDGVGSMGRVVSTGLAVDPLGNAYTLDLGTDVKKVTPEGVVSTFFGKGKSTMGAGPIVDGRYGQEGQYPLDSENLTASHDIAVDGAGNVYVTDYISVRKISPSGVGTVLVPPAYGFHPQGIAVDLNGNVYFSEPDRKIIRKITPAGDITTVAGLRDNYGFTDGRGSSARLSFPQGLATDSSGNLFVADSYNCAIRRISPDGDVTTLAGHINIAGDSGPWCSSLMPETGVPLKIAVSKSGDIFVTTDLGKLLKLSKDLTITMVADQSDWGALDGRIVGLSVGPDGSLYVSRDSALIRIFQP